MRHRVCISCVQLPSVLDRSFAERCLAASRTGGQQGCETEALAAGFLEQRDQTRLLLDATLLQVLTEGLLGLPVEPSCLAQGRAKAPTPRYSVLLRAFQELPVLPMKTAE